MAHGSVDGHRDDRLGRILAPAIFCNDGGRYNPTANSWTATATPPAHPPRAHSHGGVDRQRNDRLGRYNGSYLNDGGRYNPTANSWTALPTSGAPAARYSHTAVWTGSEMIVWGGYQRQLPT